MSDKFVERIHELQTEIARHEGFIAEFRSQIAHHQKSVYELDKTVEAVRNEARASLGLPPLSPDAEWLRNEMAEYYGEDAVLQVAELIEGDDARL